jgi:hypothetical protein
MHCINSFQCRFCTLSLSPSLSLSPLSSPSFNLCLSLSLSLPLALSLLIVLCTAVAMQPLSLSLSLSLQVTRAVLLSLRPHCAVCPPPTHARPTPCSQESSSTHSLAPLLLFHSRRCFCSLARRLGRGGTKTCKHFTAALEISRGVSSAQGVATVTQAAPADSISQHGSAEPDGAVLQGGRNARVAPR